MNSTELAVEWQRICNCIKQYENINSSQLNAFFSRLQPQAMSEDFLMLTADNDFIRTWIEIHYSQYIQRALFDTYGVNYTVAIEVDANQKPPIEQMEQPTREEMPEGGINTSEDGFHATPDQPQADATKAIPFDIEDRNAESVGVSADIADNQDGEGDVNPCNSSLASVSTLTFENFVIGESNRMAYSMAVAVAEDPGRPMLNPLFIYGRSGLGKTHLMRAIQNYIAETRPELKSIYVDSAQFLDEYVEATLAHDKQKSSFKNFKNKYQEADIFLIDDIQFFQGKEQTLDIVFQIFNHMVDEGKQVVLSADRAPKNIAMDERYQSRFNSGGTFDIQPPEVETKLGIIKSYVDEYRETSNLDTFDIPEDIERYIAENSSSNIRELKSAVTKVIYYMMSANLTKVSVDQVSVLLENHFSGGAMKKLTIADIQKQVELYYGIAHADLIGQKRSRQFVYARQIAIYLARQMLDMPYNDIAKQFGGRDHTTIMYSITSVEEKMRDNREIREEIENIKKKIREM